MYLILYLMNIFLHNYPIGYIKYNVTIFKKKNGIISSSNFIVK